MITLTFMVICAVIGCLALIAYDRYLHIKTNKAIKEFISRERESIKREKENGKND